MRTCPRRSPHTRAARAAGVAVTLTGPHEQVHLRQILQSLNMRVITEQFGLLRAHKAFDTFSRPADARHNEQVTKVVQRLIDVAGRPE